jgi:MinD-like ATPase involved in chromosome partitioning or flagellar assembly
MEETPVVPRSAVAIYLPSEEFLAVSAELAEAGYEAIGISSVDEFEALLEARPDVGLAILDGESDFDATIEMYSLLHDGERNVASLMVVSSTALDRLSLAGRARINGEFVTRPYSAASLRWRVEAMLIRAETMLIRAEALGDGSRGSILGGELSVAPSLVARRGRIVVVFNPKGGVGKTTIAINTSAVLQMRKNQRVLLVDCDTVTGHVVASLGMAEIPTVADVWRSDLGTNVNHSLAEIASAHSSGVAVLTMSRSPLHTEVLEPKRVAQAISAARDAYDWVIVDMHPDYGPLNQGIFALADHILVPVTPEVPTIRAAVQFREVAVELQIRDRLALVVNRSNSGVSSSDVEKVVGFAAVGKVRSAGMLFVKAANGGHSAVEDYPKARVVGDIEALADRLIAMRDDPDHARGSFRGFTRPVRDLLGRLTSQATGRPRLPVQMR